MKNKIKEKLKFFPQKPGVYLMKNKRGKVIYVGKAKRLKRRVKSYFTKKRFDYKKTEVLVSRVEKIDYIVTRNEVEALILEDNLIKKYQPPFNIALKDDKKYPYLKINVQESFPTIAVTRKLKKDGAKYFGPYTEARSVRRTLELIEKIFKLKTCNRVIPKDNTDTEWDRACLNYQIEKCDAPCIGHISYTEYRERIKQVILFLKGKTRIITDDLKKKMKAFSREKQFEKAADIRDTILRINRIVNKQVVSRYNMKDLDCLGIAREGKICCAVILKIREGKLIKKEHYYLKNTEDETLEVIIKRQLTQYYNQRDKDFKKLLVQKMPQEKDLLEKWLQTKIHRPQRGDKKKLLEMAKNNAFLYVEEKKLAHIKASQRTIYSVKELKDELKLKSLPRKIAAFDVSNLFGKEAVASMVFFDNGTPKKSQYRRFKIKTVDQINDYLMMEEVVTRYLSHLEEENYEKPDLMLIDGGKGQLKFAKKALDKYDYDIKLFSLAKRLEEVYAVNRKKPIVISKTSQALKLLQKLRDEAHRFAVTYHKKLRDKKTRLSRLDKIKGIGKKRKFELLKNFRSLKQLETATVEEIARLPGISNKLAEKIFYEVNKKGQ